MVRTRRWQHNSELTRQLWQQLLRGPRPPSAVWPRQSPNRKPEAQPPRQAKGAPAPVPPRTVSLSPPEFLRLQAAMRALGDSDEFHRKGQEETGCRGGSCSTGDQETGRKSRCTRQGGGASRRVGIAAAKSIHWFEGRPQPRGRVGTFASPSCRVAGRLFGRTSPSEFERGTSAMCELLRQPQMHTPT